MSHNINHLIPIIDIDGGRRFLTQALLSIQSLRKIDSQAEIILYDSTEYRDQKQKETINLWSDRLGFTYLEEVYYKKGYWEAHRYQKSVINRFYSWYKICKMEINNFIVQDSDLLWLEKVDWSRIIDPKVDFQCYQWQLETRMLADSLLYVRDSKIGQQVAALGIGIFLGSLEQPLVADLILSHNSRGRTNGITSESLMETLRDLLAIKVGSWPGDTKLLGQRVYHYATYKQDRKQKVKSYIEQLRLDFIWSDVTDLDSLVHLICEG